MPAEQVDRLVPDFAGGVSRKGNDMAASSYVPIRFPKRNILEYVQEAVRRSPERCAVVSGDGAVRLTFGEVDRRANRLASALAELGVKQGDRVAIFQSNRWQYVEQYLAILKLGAVCVPMNFRLKSPEALFILNESGAETLLFEQRYQSIFEPTLAYQLAVKNRICTVGEAPEWAMDYERLLAGSADSDPPPVDLGPDSILAICYTSGTTGLPKGSVTTHRNGMVNFEDSFGKKLIGVDAVHPELGYVVTALNVPAYHIAGIFLLYAGMCIGATTVIPEAFLPQQFMEIVQREKVTLTYLVPVMFFFILMDPGFRRYDLSSLRVVAYGAMPMDPELLQKILTEFPPGVRYMDAFGCTECNATNIAKAPEDHDLSGSPEEVEKKRKRLRGIGRPLTEGIETKIVDRYGSEVPPGVVGEVVSRGEKVTPGYWRNPEKTAAAFDRQGWFHTGDSAYRDEDGYYYFADRSGDMINRGGENIFPIEVERVLSRHPAIAEAAVFGIPDPAWGQRVMAAVVLRPGQSATEEEIIRFCKEGLASYKAPSAILFKQSLPRTFEGGKVKRNVLREECLRSPLLTGRSPSFR
ncbi:MAG: class I adenylate-forming enzyme family protein [bacterium]